MPWDGAQCDAVYAAAEGYTINAALPPNAGSLARIHESCGAESNQIYDTVRQAGGADAVGDAYERHADPPCHRRGAAGGGYDLLQSGRILPRLRPGSRDAGAVSRRCFARPPGGA